MSSKEETVAETIIRACGMSAANAFRLQFGGKEVNLPKTAARLPDDNPIIETIGREAAEKLCFEFSGSKIYVPRARGDSHLDRIEAAYVEAVKDGLNNDEIAALRGISARQVRRMLASLGIVNSNRKHRSKKARDFGSDLFPAAECLEGAILTGG